MSGGSTARISLEGSARDGYAAAEPIGGGAANLLPLRSNPGGGSRSRSRSGAAHGNRGDAATTGGGEVAGGMLSSGVPPSASSLHAAPVNPAALPSLILPLPSVGPAPAPTSDFIGASAQTEVPPSSSSLHATATAYTPSPVQAQPGAHPPEFVHALALPAAAPSVLAPGASAVVPQQQAAAGVIFGCTNCTCAPALARDDVLPATVDSPPRFGVPPGEGVQVF